VSLGETVKQKAAFFDRDGTLIKDVHYLSDINQIELLPGIIDLCLSLQEKNYLLFVITNQSGVGRGFFTENFVKKTHRHLYDIFACEGVHFHAYTCQQTTAHAENQPLACSSWPLGSIILTCQNRLCLGIKKKIYKQVCKLVAKVFIFKIFLSKIFLVNKKSICI